MNKNEYLSLSLMLCLIELLTTYHQSFNIEIVKKELVTESMMENNQSLS